MLKQWQWRDQKCVRTWRSNHLTSVLCMTFDASSTYLATGSSDFTCKIWDLNAQYCTHNLKGAQGIVRVVKFFADAADENLMHVYTGCEDSKIRVYDLNTSEMIACLEGHFSTITCFEFSESKRQLVSGSRDNVVIVWDLQTFKALRTIPVYESVEAIVFLPKSRYASFFEAIANFDPESCFLTFGNDGLVKIWSSATAQLLYKQPEKDSFKIETTQRGDKDSELNLVITQAFYNYCSDQIVLVTVDNLVVYLKMLPKEVLQIEKQVEIRFKCIGRTPRDNI
jgi:U3 small nucleolar RNA-associated protein 13